MIDLVLNSNLHQTGGMQFNHYHTTPHYAGGHSFFGIGRIRV